MASPDDSESTETSACATALKTVHVTGREQKLTKLSKEGFSNEFVEGIDVNLDIDCPFCFLVIRDATQISTCGHSFCASCWTDWTSSHTGDGLVRCPVDNEEVDLAKVFQDRKLDRYIQGLRVKCGNQEAGCRVTPELRYLQVHLDTCHYQTVVCELGCGLEMILGCLHDHMDTDCPKRMVQCPACDASMHADDLLTHGNICPMKIISCQFCLVGGFPCNKLPTHQQTECPKIPTLCSFALVGCTEKVPREDLKAHHAAQSDQHLRLLNASQLYHTTGVTSESENSPASTYELPPALWGRVCEDGTNVSLGVLPGCEVEEGSGEVALCEKVNLLEQKNDELANENQQLITNIGHLEEKMGQMREDIKANEERMQRKDRERNENEEMLDRNMNEMRENMDLEMKKSKEEMKENMEIEVKKSKDEMEEVKKSMEEIKHALAVEKVAVGENERKMGQMREDFRANDERMQRKDRELNENDKILARNMEEMKENMELDAKKNKDEMEEVKKSMEEIKHALAVEKAAAEKAAVEKAAAEKAAAEKAAAEKAAVEKAAAEKAAVEKAAAEKAAAEKAAAEKAAAEKAAAEKAAAEKAAAEKAAAEPKELVAGQRNECPCYWKVKLVGGLSKYSLPFYTSDGYKMFFFVTERSNNVYVGAVLHKADGDDTRAWPWNGPERMTVVDADTGVKLSDCDLVSLGYGGRTRPTSETYRTLNGYWLFNHGVRGNMVNNNKTVKLTMKKE